MWRTHICKYFFTWYTSHHVLHSPSFTLINQALNLPPLINYLYKVHFSHCWPLQHSVVVRATGWYLRKADGLRFYLCPRLKTWHEHLLCHQTPVVQFYTNRLVKEKKLILLTPRPTHWSTHTNTTDMLADTLPICQPTYYRHIERNT